MASHFKWYPDASNVVVPWNATFEFPSQANSAVKITPRLSPKNASIFKPGTTIRLEFPAQGYVNPENTTLEFDLNLTSCTGIFQTSTIALQYFQNNVQSIFNRVRLMYGSTPLEDLQKHNYIIRQMTELTTSPSAYPDQSSITEGIGHRTAEGQHLRRTIIQGITIEGALGMNISPGQSAITGSGTSITATSTRRYQVQFQLGLFNQGKLIPVKYMASQLAIELTLAPIEECIIYYPYNLDSSPPSFTPAVGPTYTVSDVNLIPEILEFDSMYDQHFLNGLQTGGVPIQFSTWHNFQTNVTGSNMQMIIQERSRSVKAIFAFMKPSVNTLKDDSGASFGTTCSAPNDLAPAMILSYQFRIGGRYMPAAPVICNHPGFKSGGAEAFIELQKALNTLGDYRLSNTASTLNWDRPLIPSTAYVQYVSTGPTYPNYGQGDGYFSNVTANPGNPNIFNNGNGISAQCFKGPRLLADAHYGFTSGLFCMATSLETTSGREVSGLNAEEQSDITLMVKWASNPSANIPMDLEVFTLVDQMMVLKENNVVELVV